MKRATREFVAARQRHCHYQLMVIHNVRSEPAGTLDGLANAQAQCERDPQILLTPGWLVGTRDDSEEAGTIITPHWWNIRPIEGGFEHYDTTPISTGEFEYVVDRDIAEYVRDPYNQLASTIPDHIYYEGGRWWSVDYDQDPPARTRMMDLSLPSIYYTRRNTIITLPIQ